MFYFFLIVFLLCAIPIAIVIDTFIGRIIAMISLFLIFAVAFVILHFLVKYW
jgi:hypothetical protein